MGTQGARPHSKPGFLTGLLLGDGVQVGVGDVVEVFWVVVVTVGWQEQAELYRAGAVPHAALILAGNPVVAVWTVEVKVEQNAEAAEREEGLDGGNRARRQLL